MENKTKKLEKTPATLQETVGTKKRGMKGELEGDREGVREGRQLKDKDWAPERRTERQNDMKSLWFHDIP